jgi:hypothetical protein
MTSAERRQIGQAIREYDHGRDESAREALCRLAKEHAPEKPAPIDKRTMGLSPSALHERAREEAVREWIRTAKPQPKPRKRIVDRKALKEYADTHPRCEVIACPQNRTT